MVIALPLPEPLRSIQSKIIVVGFYLGNDIYDAYNMAYQYDAHRNLRSSAAGDLTVHTVGDKAYAFWNEEKQFHVTFGRTSLSGWSFWLREHLAIGRLLNRTLARSTGRAYLSKRLREVTRMRADIL